LNKGLKELYQKLVEINGLILTSSHQRRS